MLDGFRLRRYNTGLSETGQTRFIKMAHHKSAKKRIRRNARRTEINGARMGRVRTFMKAVETAIGGGDQVVARDALKAAQPEMSRGVRSGIFHRNTVARKISRLSKRIKAMV